MATGRDGLDDLAVRLATASTRRSALGRAALGALALIGLGSARAEARKRRTPRLPGTEPIPGGWYGFCGHYFTTGSCPRPVPPAADRPERPAAAAAGRPPDRQPRPADRHERPAGGRARPPARRARRRAAPARAAHAHLRGLGARALQRRRRHAGLVVPLLRRAACAGSWTAARPRGGASTATPALRGYCVKTPPRLLRHVPGSRASRADDARHRRRRPDRGRLAAPGRPEGCR